MAQPSQPSAAVLSAIAEEGNGVMQTKYFFFAALAVSVYDHILTLDIEVEHMWKRKLSAVTVLFFFTRYYFLAAQFVDLFFLYGGLVDISLCGRYIWYVLVLITTPLTALANCIVIMRIYALYGRKFLFPLVLLLYCVAQAVASLRIDFLHSVTPISPFTALGYPQLDNVPALRFCAPRLSPKLNAVEMSLTQIMQSIFDTVALLLILIKAREGYRSGLMSLIAKQGLAYYTLNTAMYISWALLLIFAQPGNKLLMAGPAIAVGCVSVNRLTLHLRSYTSIPEPGSTAQVITPFIVKRQRRNSWLGVSTFEIPDGDGQNIYEMSDMSGDTEMYSSNGSTTRMSG